MKKTELTPTEVGSFLRERFGPRAGGLRQLVEGEESQAFSFERGGAEYVIRINRSVEGFLKDRYAWERFRSDRLPIPEVIELGQIDECHAFCVTEKMPGITLEDTDAATLMHLLEPTTQVWTAIKDVDISDTTGYGEFDSSGRGAYRSWREYLLSILNSELHDWESVHEHVDRNLFDRLMAEFVSLVESCPEERRLVHADFGANNVLADGGAITAVLDWEEAMYGDPLFDIAGAYFWRTWLECMDLQTGYYETHLSGIPGYRERLLCYQLRIGLSEVLYGAIYQDWGWVGWAARRSAEILDSGGR